MNNIKNRNILLESLLIVACVACIVISFSMYRYIKGKEFEFNEKKAVLIKETLDLKDTLSSLQKTVTESQEKLATAEDEKAILLDNIKELEEANGSLAQTYTEELEKLKLQQEQLTDKSVVFDDYPVMKRIYEAINTDDSEMVKQILDLTLRNLDGIKSGDFVELEPIVVSGDSSTAAYQKTVVTADNEGMASVVSVDNKHALVVIDKGRRDNISTGYTCTILKNGRQVGLGSVISVRYKVSAAVVTELTSGASMSDISAGDEVLLSR